MTICTIQYNRLRIHMYTSSYTCIRRQFWCILMAVPSVLLSNDVHYWWRWERTNNRIEHFLDIELGIYLHIALYI